MGTSDSKSQQKDCKTIEVDDVNFDLPGCLESLSDMAYTGKNTPLRRPSATSRALWGMSRTLSAPVTANDRSPKKPSLKKSKAVSLDSYTENYNSSNNRLSSPLSVVDEHLTLHTDSCLVDSANRQHRASPSIEVIPPDIEERLEEYSYGHERERSVSPSSLRLQLPQSDDKHSMLLEKRKKLLTKGKRIEEETPEAFAASTKRPSSQDKVTDWESIQEWMVWCIHENLDDKCEEEIFGGASVPPPRMPMQRGLLQHQYSSPGPHEPLYKTQNQLRDMHLSYHSSPAYSSTRNPLKRQDQQLHMDEKFPYYDSSPKSERGRRSPRNSQRSGKSSPSCESGGVSPVRSKSKSPIIKRIFNRESSQERSKPKHPNVLSLDGNLLKLSGQSSFESSGSSRMNSFDSTGTHNDKL